MKVHYEIEKKVIFAPETCTMWPTDDPLARITLYATASQCFLLLLQNAGDTLSQKFLFAEVWEKNGLYVNANTLYQNIAVLRKALKSIGIKEEVIKTIPRQGLKFVGKSTLIQYEEKIEALIERQAPLPDVEPDKDRVLAPPTVRSSDMEVKKASQFIPWRKKAVWLIPVTTIVLSLFLIVYSFMMKNNQTERFFNEYSYIDEFKGCKIYSTNQNLGVNHTFLSALTRLTGLTCYKGDSIWLTLNHQLQVKSAIKCSNDISSPDAKCSTWLQLGDNQ
ncbi:transcriptional regulator [Leminorella grimontii]|nr:transcriptional regulator [Leminorella grimontii]